MKHTTTRPDVQTSLINDRDFLKGIIGKFLQSILEEEFTESIGAEKHERTLERHGYRNGHYGRQLTTRVGTIELVVPRDREGTFRTELFDRYQRSEKALVLALTEMYLRGVSTRKVSSIVEELCGHTVSKSQVSDLAKQLDEDLEGWRSRPLTENYSYVMFDAIYEKVREAGRVGSVATFVAIGVTATGMREVLGCYVATSEHKVEWKSFLRSLNDRGLKTPVLAVSDNHNGIRQAIMEELPGTLWQRCQVHYMRNFLPQVNQKHQGKMMGVLREVLHAETIEEAQVAKKSLLERLLEIGNTDAADWIEESLDDTLNVLHIPSEHRKRMRSTNMLERLNGEIRRRTRVVRIFPSRASCTRLVTAICQEISESWGGRRYLNFN